MSAASDAFDKTYGAPSGSKKLSKAAVAFDKAYGKKPNAAQKFYGDVVTPTARFLGSVLEYPIALGAHAAATFPQNPYIDAGTPPPPPVKFSPTSGVEQLEAAGLSPAQAQLADIAAGLPVAGAMNVVGAKAIMPVAKAALEPMRGVPGISHALEFAKTGASLPKQYRTDIQSILRSAEGKADLSGYLRERLVNPALKMAPDEQAAFRTAIETGNTATLPAAQQQLAQSLTDEWKNQVLERARIGLRPYERRPGVEYAGGRVATRESIRKMGLRFSSEPRGLSTGLMGKIAEENLPLTTEEVAQKVGKATGMQPENVFEPIGKASLMSGAKHDARVMHARIVNDLVKRYGQPTTNIKESIARHEGIKTGFTPGIQTQLEKTKLPPQVDRLVEQLNKRMQPREYGRIQDAVQWVNRGFKKWALFSPGYVSRNLQNNVFQIAVFEDLGPKEMAMLAGAINPSQKELQDMIRLGVSGRGQTAREITGPMGPVFKGAKAANEMAEDVSRRWLYLIRRGKGDTPEKAAARVDDILFNYSQRLASKARVEVGRNYVPFVNWATFIPGLTTRAFLERPGSMALLSNIRERQNRAEGYDDERLAKEFGPWNLPLGVTATGQGKGMIPQFAGQYSVNDLVPTGYQDAVDKLLSKAYPTLGVPAGLATGREPFGSRPFEDRFATAPSSLRVLFLLPGGKRFAEAHGISIDPETKKVIAPSRLAFVLRSFPQTRLANLVADYAAGVKGKEATAASFGLGVKSVEKYEPRRFKR